MNKTLSLSLVASLALLVIPAETAFATEVGARNTGWAFDRHDVSARTWNGSQPGSDRMLNPQPLPPKEKAAAFKSYGSDRMLNPQPLPPKEKVVTFTSRGSDRMLNPQPLPPRWNLSSASSVGANRALTPQPLTQKPGGYGYAVR